ncbi:hypothetical protein BH20ACT4_BH20ACT4_06100 [soil metagenome]
MTCDGQIVRREPQINQGFVRSVLRFLAAKGFDGAPKFLGVDGGGREVVSFIPDEVLDKMHSSAAHAPVLPTRDSSRQSSTSSDCSFGSKRTTAR